MESGKDAMETKPADELLEDDAAVLRASRRHTRRSFLLAAAGAAAGFGFYDWLYNAPQVYHQPELLRKTYQANAKLSRTLFDERALAPTFPVSRAENLRVNGVIGLKEDIVPASWRLQMVGVDKAEGYPQYVPDVTAWEYEYMPAKGEDQGHDEKTKPGTEKKVAAAAVGSDGFLVQRAGMEPRGKEEAGKSLSTLATGTPGLLLTLDDVTKLPKHELVTQFKCIEGWSQIAHWSGYRMSDFIDAFPPARKADGSLPRYVYMETPNGDYYVGYDLQVCRHPQTLLVTELGGEPLTQTHGAPLRLHTPTKYGYKQIKRIGLIAYTDVKPDDYWTKLGYDWYAGL
jgi:hypothetical protein